MVPHKLYGEHEGIEQVQIVTRKSAHVDIFYLLTCARCLFYIRVLQRLDYRQFLASMPEMSGLARVSFDVL